MARCVLTIDGGGVRGIIGAKVIHEIERRSGKRVGDVVDLFVGSSVGAILAAAFAVGNEQKKAKYSGADALEFLLKFCPSIFAVSPVQKLFRAFPLTALLMKSEFDFTDFEKALVFLFADTKLRDVCKNLLIPTYDVRGQRTFMIRNWDSAFADLQIKDILLAASAAPTIFPPKRLAMGGQDCLLIDSGLVANNPVVCAYAAADVLYPGEDIYFVSIGLGMPREGSQRVRDNLLYWATRIAPIFFDAGMEAIDYQMVRIVGERYMRINGHLHAASSDITDASAANLKALQADADRIIKENSEVIDRVVQLIK